MKKSAAVVCAAGIVFANPLPGLAQDVLTTHRLPPKLSAKPSPPAPNRAITITATITDSDGVEQAVLRGDGASMTTLDAARDKAYTVLTLGAPRNEDTTGVIVQRMGQTPSAGGLAKLPHILLAQGGVED